MTGVLLWVTAAASLTAVILNIRKHRASFALWIGTNAVWAAADLTHGLPQQAALHLVYLILAAWGWHRWAPEPPASSPLET